MTPQRPIKTGKKDAKGRPIFKGPQGGLFVMNSRGNPTAPAKRNFISLNKLMTNHVRRSY